MITGSVALSDALRSARACDSLSALNLALPKNQRRLVVHKWHMVSSLDFYGGVANSGTPPS